MTHIDPIMFRVPSLTDPPPRSQGVPGRLCRQEPTIHRWLRAAWARRAAWVIGLGCLPVPLEAAISVGPLPNGTGTNPFDQAAAPATTEWASLTIAGLAADVTTPEALDADVTANINATQLVTALGTTSTVSPSISRNSLARLNTGAQWLQTVPDNTNNKYVVLMATLQNNAGAEMLGVEVSYDFGLQMPADKTLKEEVPGHRVFYSLTGAPGSWTLIPSLSSAAPGRLTAQVNVGAWAPGALLYLLWVDDNSSADRSNATGAGDEEGGYSIDNWIALPVLKPKIIAFQQGLDGYAGTVDTEIRGGASVADSEYSAATILNPDGSDEGGEVHSLLRFDNMFGTGPGQVPPGKAILAVTLTLNISDGGSLVDIHRMNKAWAANVTWNQFDGFNLDGVLSGTAGNRFEDDTEAVFTPEASIAASTTGELVLNMPVATVQAWADGAPNHGWALLPTGTDGADIASSEAATVSSRPKLTVTWGEPGEPAVQPIRHTPFGFDILIEDGSGVGAKQVDPATIQVKLDSTDVTGQCSVTKAGTVTTVAYRTTTRFASQSAHVANIAFSDNNVPPRPQNQDLPFTVVSYAVLTPGIAVPEAEIVKSKPGFMWTVHQNDALQANSNQRALQQLNGLIVDPLTELPYDNLADFTFQGVALAPAAAPNPSWAAITFELPGVINLSQTADELNGNFTPDLAMPGISFDVQGVAAEVYTYLELPAGLVTMGVNSDDGFVTTAGNASTARDALAGILAGEFDAGRGATDTIFYLVVEQAGYYAFRTLWEEGNGGANIEWFTVKEDGTKVLINDTANGGVRAYREATSTVNPYVLEALPSSVPRMVNQPSSSMRVVIADGTNPVAQNSVKLSLNGTAVTPTITRQGQNLIATYRPADLQIPSVVNRGKVEFTDSTGAHSRSSEWSFRNFKNIVLPAPAIVETFESTAEGEVPTGWLRVNFTDCSAAYCTTPGLDVFDLDSDTYKDWVVVNEATLQSLKASAFNVPPGQFVNGVELTKLIEGNLVYAESDTRDGDQVQFLTTRAFDLSGFTKKAVLFFHCIYEQNQDSIGAIEYSIDDGATWRPVAYFLEPPDIKLNADGSVDGLRTMNDANADTATWVENGVTKGDTYGALIAAPITAALGDYIEPRLNDDDNEGKRPEVYYLPDAAGKTNVRLRFAQGGTGSWYFGFDNLGLYDVEVSLPEVSVPPVLNAPGRQGDNLVLSWTGTGTLEQADAVNGPWSEATSQANPQTVPTTGAGKFYRLRQ